MHLLHYESKSFLEGSKNCAEIDKSCNMVKLNAQGSKMVCFVVEPRYKYRNEGSPVNYGDVVVFRNLKSNYIFIFRSVTLLSQKEGILMILNVRMMMQNLNQLFIQILTDVCSLMNLLLYMRLILHHLDQTLQFVLYAHI